MADPEAAHKAAMKASEDDLIAKEKARLTQLKLTNPSLFDNKLKFVVTKLLYSISMRRTICFALFLSRKISKHGKVSWPCTKQIPSLCTQMSSPLRTKAETTTGSEGDSVTTTLTNSQAALLLILYMYTTQWIKGVPPRHSFTVDLESLVNHPTKWDKQDLYQYNQIHFWSDVDIWKKKNKEVPSTVNTSNLTPVLCLPSPASMSEYKQNLDQWNKGKHDYQKYPILNDDTNFTNWKDRYVTYAKNKYMGRMVNKNTKFRDVVDKHDIDL